MLYPNATRDDRVRDYLPPVRIVASSQVQNPQLFVNNLVYQSMQADSPESRQIFKKNAWILVDFGREIMGGIRLTTARTGGTVRIRFGESVSEAMATPNQDHSIHDQILTIPPMGTTDFGSTGFRFLRLDALGDNELQLMGICAIAVYHDYPQTGTFTCNDQRINQIRDTALYTVQLNMQDYIYDGIKRDRLVWLGDLNPEIRVILNNFSDLSLIPKSLDFVRDSTPLPNYMNTLVTYTAWWVINQYDYFMHTGDRNYLNQQRDYLKGVIDIFRSFVSENGKLDPKGTRCFLDWPTNHDREIQEAGTQGLYAIMFRDAEQLCRELQETEAQATAHDCAQKLMTYQPDPKNNKTAAAMLTLSGVRDCTHILTANPLKGVSTFFGYYMLSAQPVSSALNVIRNYWGAMLDYGATTFWEDFNLDWIKNTTPIDQLPDPNKDDLHADFGDYCYKGLRHSLCHGWAGGPAAFLPEKILGIEPLKPGCQTLLIKPDLGDLDFAQGTYPTPKGIVSVKVQRGLKTQVSAPNGIDIKLLD